MVFFIYLFDLFIYLQNLTQVKAMDEGSNMTFKIDCTDLSHGNVKLNAIITLKFCECQSPDGKSKCSNPDGKKKVCQTLIILLAF